MDRFARRIAPLLAVFVLLVGALGVLLHEFGTYPVVEALDYVNMLAADRLLLALALTACSYGALTGYDALGLRYVHYRLPYSRTMAASLIGFGISNTVGYAWLTGGAVRYRLYTAAGLPPGEVGRVVVFGLVTFWSGILAVAAGLLISAPVLVADALLSPAALRAVGIVCVMCLGGYFAWCKVGGPMIGAFAPPPLPLAVKQVALGSGRVTLAAGALYVLLPVATGEFFFHVLAAFVLGVAAGALGQVPGAAGVLEAMVLVLLPDSMPKTSVLGGLVAFRIVYYLLPLSLAVTAFGVFEARRWWPERRSPSGSAKSHQCRERQHW